jgi:hypothetical protein
MLLRTIPRRYDQRRYDLMTSPGEEPAPPDSVVWLSQIARLQLLVCELLAKNEQLRRDLLRVAPARLEEHDHVRQAK